MSGAEAKVSPERVLEMLGQLSPEKRRRLLAPFLDEELRRSLQKDWEHMPDFAISDEEINKLVHRARKELLKSDKRDAV